MSKTRDALKTPIFSPRVWGKAFAGRPLTLPWFGLDTERNTANGNVVANKPKNWREGDFVCGFIDNVKTTIQFQTFDDIPPGTHFAWNMGYDIEAMVRDLGFDEGWAMREDGTAFDLDGARCIYYHGKRFEYANAGGRRIFLEASSFFNRISLKEAAKTLCVCKCEGCVGHKKEPSRFQHCGQDEWKCPTKDPVDASKMSLSRYESDKRYRELVDKYCIKDARLVYRLMTFLSEGFKDLQVDIGGTPGSTARRFLSNMQPFPKVVWTTHREFLNAYCGGRFEVWKRGVFGHSVQDDLISAYPWALSRCPMLSPNAFHRFTRRLSENALYGSYEIGFDTDEYLGALPGWKGSTRIYSKGEDRGWICKPELDWLQAHGYDFKIHRGVEVFDESSYDGWKELIVPLFNQKQGHSKRCLVFIGGLCDCGKELKGSPLSLGAKVAINSMYGILIQLIEKGGRWVPIEQAVNPVDFAGFLALEKGPKAFEAGPVYAPLYSATLTSMVRTRILDAVKEIGEENAVASHTDSVLRTGGKLRYGSGLGDWEKKEEGDELIILKSGQYAIADTVKGRGFSKRKMNPLDEDEIATRQKVDLWAETHLRRSRVSVKTATTWRDVSVIRERPVMNNLAWELKRKWDRAFDRRMIARREWIDSEALHHQGE